jgi:acyl-CoA thioesterase-2
MLASFQIEQAGLEHQYRCPSASAPNSLDPLPVAMQSNPKIWPDFYMEWGSVDIRPVPPLRAVPPKQTDHATPADRPLGTQVWFKTSDPMPADPMLHHSVLACLLDLTLLSVAVVPHGIAPRHDGYQVASLDHSVWFHRPVHVDQWLLYDQISPWAGAGRGLAQGHIYSAQGTLVATVMQEGMIRADPCAPTAR